uniref:Fibronectin type-III domain-containing protein n=1 Tax=Periophthalmus magnuspinnatus TaxID=409849 RepID=A0A3B4ALC6_9GOBI
PIDSTTLEITFVPVAGVTKYIIRALDTLNPPTFIEEVEVTSSPGRISNLQAYKDYKLSIMASNGVARSQPTQPVTAKTLLPPPQMNSSSPNDHTIDVSWNPTVFAVNYTVSLLKQGAIETHKITKSTNGTNISFTGLEAGVVYDIDCYAFDVDGRKGEFANSSQATRPPTPASVTVTMVTNSTSLALNVSWTVDPNVNTLIWYNVSSDQGVNCSSTSSLSCELSPVTCGTVYSVKVTASNVAGPSLKMSAITTLSCPTVPCPPQGLTVTETTSGNCTFSWGTVAHAERYLAYIKNGFGTEKVCNETGSSCDFSCECGYTYVMSVFAVNAAGKSPPGPMINYTTVPCCPSSMNVSLIGPDTLKVVWDKARGAEVYETQAVNNSQTILCNDTATMCVLSYLKCDTSYNTKVIPCNDISGCNQNCLSRIQDTAPCTPTNLGVTKVNSSAVNVHWTNTNRNATVSVTVNGVISCTTGDTSCDITGLNCGSSYKISVTAANAAGDSLPSYSELYETGPCCPSTLDVQQITQAMTNVSWSSATGAHTFRTFLNSSKGHAGCHTEDTHCIMGCITCSTNYTISMEAYSLSGLQTNCSYSGFSSSLCCPSGIKLYRISTTGLRVSWRSSPGPTHRTEVNMTGNGNAYTCTALPGVNYCDISGVQCGMEYTVVVAPIKPDGSPETFCPHRVYSGNRLFSTCASFSFSVYFRGKRSVE